MSKPLPDCVVATRVTTVWQIVASLDLTGWNEGLLKIYLVDDPDEWAAAFGLKRDRERSANHHFYKIDWWQVAKDGGTDEARELPLIPLREALRRQGRDAPGRWQEAAGCDTNGLLNAVSYRAIKRSVFSWKNDAVTCLSTLADD